MKTFMLLPVRPPPPALRLQASPRFFFSFSLNLYGLFAWLLPFYGCGLPAISPIWCQQFPGAQSLSSHHVKGVYDKEFLYKKESCEPFRKAERLSQANPMLCPI